MSSLHGMLGHVGFSTKYRRPTLAADWRDNLYAYIGGTIRDHKASLLAAGGIEDHVHLLICFHPRHAISSTIQLLKANSSRWVNQNALTDGRFS